MNLLPIKSKKNIGPSTEELIERGFDPKNGKIDVLLIHPPSTIAERYGKDDMGEFGGDLIPIFAGPNMVESKDLIFDVAKNIKSIGAHFMRGGAFKPLTFPYRNKKYTETREDGIKWLGLAKEKTINIFFLIISVHKLH